MASNLSKEEFIEILQNPAITYGVDLAVFQTIYGFEGHKAYASQVGRILGKKGTRPASPINLQIGRLAKRIAQHYDIGFSVRETREYTYWDLFFDGWSEKTFFVWQLKPNLVAALEEASLTGESPFVHEIL
jgi:5-methylcytosine-specific restriction enzyme A